MHESKWDITAIPAATDVSFPYALGITMVLSPKGMAREQSPQIKRALSMGMNLATNKNANGNTIRRKMEIKYVLTSVNVFLKLMVETVIPVRSIATGDIQSPEVFTTFSNHIGR